MLTQELEEEIKLFEKDNGNNLELLKNPRLEYNYDDWENVPILIPKFFIQQNKLIKMMLNFLTVPYLDNKTKTLSTILNVGIVQEQCEFDTDLQDYQKQIKKNKEETNSLRKELQTLKNSHQKQADYLVNYSCFLVSKSFQTSVSEKSQKTVKLFIQEQKGNIADLSITNLGKQN